MATAVTAPPAQPATGGPSRRRLGSTGIIYLALVAILVLSYVLVAASGQNLFSTTNVTDMLTRSSLLGFVAIGQTFAILCRSLDLSVGYVVAWTSLVAATTMAGDPSRIGLGVAAALAVAALVGLLNGLAITVLRVNPFIATLGMGLIIKGYLDTQYRGPAGEVPGAFQGFGYTRMGVLPISTAVMLVLAALGVVLLRRTRAGYRMFAVGGNRDAARLSGIPTGRTLVLAHVLCSVCAGVAGLLIAARFGTGSALVYGSGYDLDSIAAVILGGTLLMGGRGSVAGTLAGVLILAVLDTVFNVLQVDPFFKDVLRGVIIIAAVAIYARRQIDPLSSRARFLPGRHGPGSGRSGAGPTGGSAGTHPAGQPAVVPMGDGTSADRGAVPPSASLRGEGTTEGGNR